MQWRAGLQINVKHLCTPSLRENTFATISLQPNASAGPSCFHSLTRIQRWRWSSMQKPAMASHFKTMGPTPAQHLQGPGAGTLSIIRELSQTKSRTMHYEKKNRIVEWQLRSLKAPKGPPSPGTVESIAITKSASLHFPLYAKTGSEYIPIRRRCIHVKFQTIKSQAGAFFDMMGNSDQGL